MRAPRKSTCCGFYPSCTDEGVEVCASCLLPVSEQPTELPESACEWCGHRDYDGTVETCEDGCCCPSCENDRALDDDADMYAENQED